MTKEGNGSSATIIVEFKEGGRFEWGKTGAGGLVSRLMRPSVGILSRV